MPKIAGWEGWLAPAQGSRHPTLNVFSLERGKPPFPTCDFRRLKLFTRSPVISFRACSGPTLDRHHARLGGALSHLGSSEIVATVRA